MKKTKFSRLVHGLGLAAALAASATLLTSCGEGKPVSAEDFYRGKTISIIVGFPVGGGYDSAARLLSRHLGKYIPGNPTILVQNMPGAAGFVAVNHVYNAADKDGLTLAIGNDTTPIAPFLKIGGANYDALAVGWIGSLTARADAAVILRTDSAVKTIEDARTHEAILGSAGQNSPTTTYPRLLNELIGTKFKVIHGYPGTPETWMAVERGELDGRAGTNWSAIVTEHPDWVKRKFLHPVLLLTLKPYPGLEHVPLVMEYVRNDADREVINLVFGIHEYSRVLSAPPGTPPERIALLRKAFVAAGNDPQMIEEAKTIFPGGLSISQGEDVEAFIRKVGAMPDAVRERAQRYVASD